MAILYRWVGINTILLSGLIHLSNVYSGYRDAPYLILMFVAHFLGTAIAAIGISWGGRLWGWVMGGFLAAGAIVDYLISRTVGLPSIGVVNWGPALAYFSIFLEVIFFVPFLASYQVNLRRAYGKQEGYPA